MRLKEDTAVEIDVKEAVRLAKVFAADLLEAEKISDLGLEAVERSEDGHDWLVTLGFSKRFPRRLDRFADQLIPVLTPEREREYKVFQVDGESGAVVAMKVFDP